LTDHPTSAEIAGLARGTLSRDGLRRLVRHLLHGCPRCSGLLAPALELSPALLALYARGRGRGDSRAAGASGAAAGGPGSPSRRLPGPRLAGARPARSAAGPGAPAEDDYELPVARACATAVRRFRELERERRAGAAAPPAEGVRAAAPLLAPPAPPALLAPVRGLLKVEMLLAASWELRYDDPHEMVKLAELALFAAERLEPVRYGRAAIADARARTWAELGNAHRVADDLVQAEQAMARAVGWQRRGSGDPWLVARIADLMAALLADQRRFAEAGELLVKVEAFYRRLGDRHLAGQALIRRGIYFGYDNDPRRALGLLVEGLDLIDGGQDSRLAVQAVHAILWNLVGCGRHRQARIHLWRSRPLLLRHGGKLARLRLHWLEGRIHAGLGELDRAERELLATRQGFAAAGSPYNAALASLDLAAVWLRQGRTRQVRRLVEEMIATFRALRIAREAVAALLVLREACDRDEATLDRVQAVAVLLTELERQPRRRPGAEPSTEF
jgi:tetratricopeptide (TPR) repeat protein